ncbi:hypothetical protein SAMN04487765_3057 [Tenacibaculum sp. MAR_2010_89]|uniref:hypothetical protein n=1 Tax=Tenacibaculum sp. MAR_2010_89 TaxID=1250198 RepID=UPI00089A3C10|nr:hypothetical protein [Tenacibaculum sp. MAR_2010_89]SEE54833.1 hypothetical protein SAMN04487765_3057 [Tenacibaculum sp. MAR_2010_89]
MKHFKNLFLLLLITISLNSCNTAQLIEQWKNPEIDSLSISKVLIVGLTPNIEARKKFENQLKKELESRGIEAVISLDVFEPSFRIEKKSKEELKVIENILTTNYFDAVLLSKVKGVENRVIYSKNYISKESLDIKFKEDYYNHQEIIENPKYYEKYKIYNAETSLYCICPTKDRELIWKGSIDIIDPKSVDKTVDDYINLLMIALEEQNLLRKK